jgi:hypothetical protein
MVKFPRVFTGLWAFQKAFYGLIRRLQTTVEHMRVTNDAGVDMTRGQVIALTAGQRRAILADASAADTAAWVGVMAEDTADGATGIARINGYALVQFDNGETPAAGDPVYVSDTAGNATTLTDGTFASRIGTIGDASPYVTITNPFCWVFLQHCCTPTEVQVL